MYVTTKSKINSLEESISGDITDAFIRSLLSLKKLKPTTYKHIHMYSRAALSTERTKLKQREITLGIIFSRLILEHVVS